MTLIAARPALALAYFTYFGVLGIFVPYLGLFLDGRGFDSREIGLMLAIVTATRIVGPAIWAGLAERSSKPLRIMQLGAVLACIGWLGSFIDGGFGLLLAALALFSFFWTAILPQLEVSAFLFLNNNTEQYSRIRSAGSVGYIVLVMLGGWLYQQYGSEFMPAAALAFLLLLVFCLFNLPALTPAYDATAATLSYRQMAKHRVLWIFMGAALLMQVSFAPFYGFFTLYSRDLGYSGSQTGLLISLAVAAEIVAFYYAGRIMRNRSYRLLLGICYGLTAVRWLMVALLAHSGWWLALSMLLHAGSFAIAHSCAMQFIQQIFPKAQRGRGQAIYAGLIFGGGGAIGAYLAGFSWQNGTGAVSTFVFAAGFALLACLLVLALPKKIADIA
ncbi:arabinose ABC transporter permease [Arsukibacterium ikkense]|uniref:Arabinose ABC transporter permease n=1 Tax=Arsukibacterium ikkense TaxID=336831 RepID=A0A0M2V8A1_9GAMM|nr:MFS transporter [Arsukibacterium ikkense]KKO46841.1 arabinose ABC transporter permease [Arsukibacterium ikkense]